ncbi:unnamed protein product [Caenorhabditis brenneri]
MFSSFFSRFIFVFKNEPLLLSSILSNIISYAIGIFLLAYESYPFIVREPDCDLVVIYFLLFNILSLFGTFLLLSNRILVFSVETLKKCAYYVIAVTVVATFFLFNPNILEQRNSKISVFNLYNYSARFLWISYPLFLLNNAFATWYLWTLGKIREEFEKKEEKRE